MGNTRYYTLCEDTDRLVYVMGLILHHNAAEYEDVGEALYDVRYVEISDQMKAFADKDKGKKYIKFKAARYLITCFNQGGRNSTRPFFEERGVDPDENHFIPAKAMERISDYDDTTIAWKIICPSCKILHEEGGREKLNACIREEISALQATV